MSPLPTVLLAVVLAVTSVSMAVARHAPRAARAMELCAAGGTGTVALDERGRPVAPAHPCPDCVIGGLALPPAAAVLPVRAATAARRRPLVPATGPVPCRRGGRRRARAPPSPV
jgi:hypothetical protein